MKTDDPTLTFRELGRSQGVPDPDPAAAKWPLEIWYLSVLDKPIGDFTHKDLTRACQQNFYHSYIVPHCIARLEVDALAGDLYDGELLTALSSVENRYWTAHPHQARAVLNIIRSALQRLTDEYPGDFPDLEEAFEKMLARFLKLTP